MTEAHVDRERQEEARLYAAIKRRLYLLDLILSGALILAVILTGAALALRTTVDGLTTIPVVVVALYLFVLGIGYSVVIFPLTLYSGLVLPRRYRLSVQSFGGWFADYLKGAGLGLVFGLGLIEGLYALISHVPTLWWLVAGVLYLFVTVILANLAPVLLLPLFYKLTPIERPELVNQLEELARRAGVRVRGVYSMNMSSKTTAANAALVGLGNTRRVILGDTLLDQYPASEIETVFAHELGHQVHRDIPKLIVVQSAITLVGLYIAKVIVDLGVVAFGYRSASDVATMPVLFLALGVFALVTMPVINAYSRHVERAADRYALETTRDPLAFVSAMTRLANQNLSEIQPPGWIEFLLYDHPSIGQRIRMAERYARAAGGEP